MFISIELLRNTSIYLSNNQQTRNVMTASTIRKHDDIYSYFTLKSNHLNLFMYVCSKCLSKIIVYTLAKNYANKDTFTYDIKQRSDIYL